MGPITDFELPSNLVQAADKSDDATLVTRGMAAVSRRTWLAELPTVVRGLSERWSLDIGQPFQPGGVASWVAPARNAADHVVVIKVAWLHEEAMHEADGLRTWNGSGAVRLLDAITIGNESVALLLEACQPGTALSLALSPPEQDEVVAGLLRRLWISPPSNHPFRPLKSLCDHWADRFEERYAAARGHRIDPGLVRASIELSRSLPATADRHVLLCTDLHAGNVLSAEREPWLAIDPKPYVGDPAYDPLQHMLNCPERLESDPGAFVQRMADLVGLDPDRLRLWLFVRCAQESLDQPHLTGAVTALAP